MKRILYTLILLLLANLSPGQFTRLADHANLTTGFPLNQNMAVFVSNRDEGLWISNGARFGTQAIETPVEFDCVSGQIVWNGVLYFSGVSEEGAELWATDGTLEGTQLLKDINPLGSSTPCGFFATDDAIYFFAESPGIGRELWKTDGTTRGTSLVRDINNGPGSSFTPNTVITGYKDLIFFNAKSSAGEEPWRSDGTVQGTFLVKDIRAGAASSVPKFLASTENGLVFSAEDGWNGRELWSTSGLSASTYMLCDIYPGPAGYDYGPMVEFKGRLFFAGTDEQFNLELWTTDGTVEGTDRFVELEEGKDGSYPQLANSIIINDKLVFPATTKATGTELFMTDGTPEGTTLLRDMVPGVFGSNPVIMRDVDEMNPQNSRVNLYHGGIFFKVTSASGTDQLWFTNGTPTSTLLMKDFGATGQLGTSWFYTLSGFYFDAAESNFEFEVFKSQGTPETTGLFADINPNPGEGSQPILFPFLLNGRVIAAAFCGGLCMGEYDLFALGASEQPLPMMLISFGATKGQQGVLLQWSTGNELNTRLFELERSLDGTHFQTLKAIPAAGEIGKRMNYSVIDHEANMKLANQMFYRLKMIDKDGTYRYSQVAAVVFGNPVITGIQANPNPARDMLRLTFQAGKAGQAEITVFAAGGQAIMSRMVKLNAGYNQQVLSLEGLPAGVYHAEIRTPDERQVVRIVKQ